LGPEEVEAFRRAEGPTVETGLITLLNLPALENYRSAAATLCYKRYPGSGLNLRPPDVGRMEWSEIVWWYRWLADQWEAEERAIEKANRAK
jgi:hypothetical protein